MRNTLTATLGILTGFGLMSLGATASAAALTCLTGDENVTVNSASACAVTPGQNDGKGIIDTLVFNPGNLGPYSWTYLDKDNRSNDTLLDNENNQIAGAQENWFTGGITDPGSQLNGHRSGQPAERHVLDQRRAVPDARLQHLRALHQAGPRRRVLPARRDDRQRHADRHLEHREHRPAASGQRDFAYVSVRSLRGRQPGPGAGLARAAGSWPRGTRHGSPEKGWLIVSIADRASGKAPWTTTGPFSSHWMSDGFTAAGPGCRRGFR